MFDWNRDGQIDLLDIDIWFGYDDDSPATIDLNGHIFNFVQELEPKRNLWGKVKQFTPQVAWFEKYQKALHSFGHGPFCKFSINFNKYYKAKGVYAIFDQGSLLYIGTTENLAQKINYEYGRIYAKDCYAGSPESNCKINSFVLYKYLKQEQIFLFFLETADYDAIMLELVQEFRPPINLL